MTGPPTGPPAAVDTPLRRRLLLLIAGFFGVAVGAALPALLGAAGTGHADAVRSGTPAAAQSACREQAGRAVAGERRDTPARAPGARPTVFWAGLPAAHWHHGHWDHGPADRAVAAYDHAVAVLADAFAAGERRSRAAAANGRAAALPGLAPSAVRERGPPASTGPDVPLS
ncbi:hypothetical protein GCM10009678_37470 [Actinomadura kijaniata]|uniref:hypothetical protein n=1 Tax=Actinomadura kijaniata TaxID=46161 RepID=UPI002FE76099